MDSIHGVKKYDFTSKRKCKMPIFLHQHELNFQLHNGAISTANGRQLLLFFFFSLQINLLIHGEFVVKNDHSSGLDFPSCIPPLSVDSLFLYVENFVSFSLFVKMPLANHELSKCHSASIPGGLTEVKIFCKPCKKDWNR